MTKEIMELINEVNRPTAPCEDCMKNEAASFHQSQGCLRFVHCSHNHAGGVWMKTESGGVWNIYSPIIQSEFADVVTSLTTTFLYKQKMELRNKGLTRKH